MHPKLYMRFKNDLCLMKKTTLKTQIINLFVPRVVSIIHSYRNALVEKKTEFAGNVGRYLHLFAPIFIRTYFQLYARARGKYRSVSFSFFKIEESSITLLRNAEILARTKVAR